MERNRALSRQTTTLLGLSKPQWSGIERHGVGICHDAGRSPLGAPPWRFWAPGPRFSHRHLRRIGHSELLAPRS
jgi:hypothetical protein